jgi:hypothetical protein
VIREAIRKEGMVALGKVVFTSREHIIALEPRDKGVVGVTLRYPYEVRQPEEYFDTIDDEKVPKDMLDLREGLRQLVFLAGELILIGSELLYAALHYGEIKRHRLKLRLHFCRNCSRAGRGRG